MNKGDRMYFETESEMMDWLVFEVQGKDDAWKLFFEVDFDREEKKFFAQRL